MIGGKRSQPGPQPTVRDFRDAEYAITVMVEDVDKHYAHAVAEGVEIFGHLADQPWGWRDYEPIDMEGRFWNFSQILPV